MFLLTSTKQEGSGTRWNTDDSVPWWQAIKQIKFLPSDIMNLKLKPDKYLRYLHLPHLFTAKRTKEILSVNPTIIPHREEAKEVATYVYDYDASTIEERFLPSIEACYNYKTSGRVSWINIDGLRKAEVEAVCSHFDIHPLIVEDILSVNQRPKIEEAEETIFCLLNMLYYNKEKNAVEQEQISIILGNGFVLSFQEDAGRDVFNPLRERLKSASSKVRQRGADYLCYMMLDMIVDNYFLVMENLGTKIEELEEEVGRGTNPRSLMHITQVRKELIVLKRNFSPVREVINVFIRSESKLLDERTTKYFKDVYDHIVQALDLSENYRDVMVSLQDLHVNNVNLKMNEVMKVMAIVTCLLAPATVIGGIFGMNFDENVNFLHQKWGFYTAVGMMLLIPVAMLYIFRRRGWF
jgi:magnesium transporter